MQNSDTIVLCPIPKRDPPCMEIEIDQVVQWWIDEDDKRWVVLKPGVVINVIESAEYLEYFLGPPSK